MEKSLKAVVEGTVVPAVAALIRERLAVDGQVPTDAEIVRLLKFDAEAALAEPKPVASKKK